MRSVMGVFACLVASGCQQPVDDGGLPPDARAPQTDAGPDGGPGPDADLTGCWGGAPLAPGPEPGWPAPDAGGEPPVIFCPSNDACPEDMYCPPLGTTGPWSACARSATSVERCEPRPAACADPTPDDLPVCGCDGSWYATACHAEQAGTKVAEIDGKTGAGEGCDAAPDGFQACGPRACRRGLEYCHQKHVKLSTFDYYEYSCRPLTDGLTCEDLVETGECHGCFVDPPVCTLDAGCTGDDLFACCEGYGL